MKKTLVSALTTALVVGAASTTFAAANPFEDVPADHWAYDAIAQLAADGVIEGYGDGTYRGDQEITRYEMAQMIARAMAKGGGDKALIDKLAAEFADELNNLGVRVAALEKKVDNVKWLGNVSYIYKTTRWEHDGDDSSVYNWGGADPREYRGHKNQQYVRLRLEPEMTINKNWTGHARLDYRSSMNTAKNATNGEIDEGGDNEFQVERMWVQGDYKNFQILLGKLPYVTNVDNGMIFDENVSGGQITVGSDIKATLTVGRTNNLDGFAAEYPLSIGVRDGGETSSYQSIEIYNDRDSKFTWGLGYHRVANETYFTRYAKRGSDETKKAANIWEAGLGYKFTDTLSLSGAYAWNTTIDDSAWEIPGNNFGPKNSKNAWTVQLDYKGADETDKGSWGAYVAYRRLGYGAVIAPTYDAMAAGWKGVELGVSYVPMKNFMATFLYFRGQAMSPLDVPADMFKDVDTQRFYTELNFFF